jgi:EpsI family protein
MYVVRSDSNLAREKPVRFSAGAAGTVPLWFAWVLAAVLLVSAGIGYRVLASGLHRVVSKPIELPVPLGTFPSQIGNWYGKDLSIPSTTKEYMEKNFADDYLTRRYINSNGRDWADLYVVYCSSRPAGIKGHRPRVCYRGFGWIHDSTRPDAFASGNGREIPCLVHRFHSPAPRNDHVVVLNFYVLNGKITADEKDFSGLLGRRPNIAGDLAKYVAQVQISSRLENSVRKLARDTADLILDYLPDEDGGVRAADYADTR